MKKTCILAILDGWGIGKLDESNPIYQTRPQAINFIEKNFPSGALQASGLAVGLPWEEESNSEVGHLTIGAGRVLYQHFLKISQSIKDGNFFENETLKKVFAHARENQSVVHLVGLLTESSVHASFEHLIALLQMAKRENSPRVFLHLFTDGRDSAPRSAMKLIKKLKDAEDVKIASLMGRYYGMNRDGHWERTENAYRALTLTDTNLKPKTLEEITKTAYEDGLSDEFIQPSIVDEPHPIQDNDSVLFFNFREDRMIQLTEPFINPDFNKFTVKKFSNLFLTTMTEYQEKFPAPAAFKAENVPNPLGEVLADNQKIQLRIAETEKYAHVTYFFNGLRKEPFPGEYRILIPSAGVAHHDERPEMMAKAITDRALIALNEGGFDFILVNFANPDMIAHTGNYEATLAAIKTVDREIERLMKSALTHNHNLIITSDHGNAEALINLRTGESQTKHDINPVPFYLIAKEYQKKNPILERQNLPVIGMLSDVAPTILELMNLPKPEEMTGQSLLEQLI